MKKGQKWHIANMIVGVIAGVSGLLSILTQSKASKYEEEMMCSGLEKRYGLIPKQTDEEA